MAVTAILGIALTCFSISDIKKKSINLVAVGILFLIMIAACVLSRKDVTEMIMGILPGGVIAILSFASKGKIGIGDGLVFLTIGIWTGPEKTLSIMFISLVLSALTGIILLLLKKATRKTALPFVPFIYTGYALCEIINYIE